MIHLVTKGGLGNQMFQYAFATQVQQKHDSEPIYINDFYQPLNGDNRRLGLSHFKLTTGTRVCSRFLSYYYMLAFLLRVGKRIGVSAFFRALGKNAKWKLKKVLVEHKALLHDVGLYFSLDFFGAPEVRRTWGNKHIFGYHLSTSVVSGIEDKLREAFSIASPVSEKNKVLRKEIESCNAVCLHIRRGDYRLYKQLQVCTEHYYREAVHQAVAELENPVFYVFSTSHDDIEWIKVHYRFPGDIRYVDLDNVDYEELYLMMACKHFIISNSTFSWWAAFLGKLPDAQKRVWAPRPWFASSKVEMYLSTWTIIDTQYEKSTTDW